MQSCSSDTNAAQIYINENTYQSEGYALEKGKTLIYTFKETQFYFRYTVFFITFYVVVYSSAISRCSNWNFPSVFHFTLALCLLNRCLRMHSERKGHPKKKNEMIKKLNPKVSRIVIEFLMNVFSFSCASFEGESERKKVEHPSFIEDKVTGRQLSWMHQNRHKLSKLYED